MAKKNKKILWIIGIIVVLIIFTSQKKTAEVCVSDEPTTREQLIQWGSQLKLQGGIWGSSEPFLLFPEKESACSNGYFPCLPSEMDNMPIENMLCNEFYNYIISSQGNWEIYQEIHNKKVYRQILGDEYYALCIENDKIAINTGYMEVINEYFGEFYTCQEECIDTTWTPATSTVDKGTTFTQTSNCGNTRSATGTKEPTDDKEWYESPIIWIILGIIVLFGIFMKGE